MPQSEHSWFRKVFRRLTGLLSQRARKEPEPPVRSLTLTSLLQRSLGHPIAAGQPWLSFRKTELLRRNDAR